LGAACQRNGKGVGAAGDTDGQCASDRTNYGRYCAKAEAAASDIDIDEAATRTVIDAQLRTRSWEVDTPTLRYATGTRPAKGLNLAIAEWPTKSFSVPITMFFRRIEPTI
jgi:type I restriction enzyme R subunit